jgi:LacI family transcriptional regulator
MPRRTTVTEVAERAGVSIASVSRVLNGLGARPDTEERVRRAALELGYVPDAAAKALKLGRSLQLAFAVDDIANPVYAQMMHGVESGLLGSGSRLLVSSTGRRPDDLVELVQGLSRGAADGLIISPLRRSPQLIDALVKAPVPVVVIGDAGPDAALDTVRTDSARGVEAAVAHLVATGRRRIAFVNGPADTVPGRSRLEGFTLATAPGSDAERAGIRADVVEARDFTVAAGEVAWSRVVAATDEGTPVDAVVAANDLIALGLARAALTAGRSVPGDLAVVGVDDIEMAAIFRPSLTTVSLEAHERGRLAAELLLRRLENPQAPVVGEFVAPRLVVRESSGAPTEAATQAAPTPTAENAHQRTRQRTRPVTPRGQR